MLFLVKNTEYFKDKKITIVGLARSGLACANLLYDLGARVYVSDNQDNRLTAANLKKLKSEKIKAELGKHTPGFIKDKDLIVVSPGVSNESEAVIWAGEFNIPVISEIELGFLLCPAQIIAITGSSGKTTVTTLIGEILKAKQVKAVVCGNIGNPFCAELDKLRPGDYVSLEVSSFQLERIDKFRPKIALILNLTRNHLDRYSDMQEYINAKKRIFMNQENSDYLILNGEDEELIKIGREARSKVIYFSKGEQLNPNQAAVVEVGSILGIEKELCLKVFADFKGIEHRMEEIAELNNVKFINDSKATTAESAIWAIENIKRPIVLIAGGRHKGIDYSMILKSARKKVKKVVLIGEAKELIADALEGSLAFERADTMQEAVSRAFSIASPGDCVLLSPMCSSFDMFSDYEERGRVFKEAVSSLELKMDCR
ncbi:MAG: UDP-N-acetylmuramoyl-L-alanine--D-glutamate ligase [Candidatus Omnitrophica bacterium]|nr:UDP-N-acetylmuramoyl-L-alanine--D-glutamate ligase [Candidatus Omnitrophota bacterium]